MRESSPYRAELFQFAEDFKKRQKLQIWRDDSLSKAERMLFVGFMHVRKLIECKKVSDVCARSSTQILRAAIVREREVSDFMRDDLFDDLKSPDWSETRVDVHQLADKVIHAWWIVPIQNETHGLDGFILTTDRQRNTEFWWIPINSVIGTFHRFSTEVITEIQAARNGAGKLTYWLAR